MQDIGRDQPVWVRVVMTVTGLRENPMTYPACPHNFNGRMCQKKLFAQVRALLLFSGVICLRACSLRAAHRLSRALWYCP